MKITPKVAFNIASEASFVYILSEQKFIKMPIIEPCYNGSETECDQELFKKKISKISKLNFWQMNFW